MLHMLHDNVHGPEEWAVQQQLEDKRGRDLVRHVCHADVKVRQIRLCPPPAERHRRFEEDKSSRQHKQADKTRRLSLPPYHSRTIVL